MMAGLWSNLILILRLILTLCCSYLGKAIIHRQKKTILERMVLCGLVEPGGIEPPSASPLQAVLHA